MVWLWTLDAHTLHGPFSTKEKAHAYANRIEIGSYELIDRLQQMNMFMFDNLRLTKLRDR